MGRQLRWQSSVGGNAFILGVSLLILGPGISSSSTVSLTCNFNNTDSLSQCGWLSDVINGFAWSRSGGPALNEPGPFGTITATSPFLYANSSNASPGKRSARLVSQPITVAGGIQTQLRFHYHMFGFGINDFEVNLERGTQIRNVFKDGRSMQSWQTGVVELCEEQPFTVVFEAKFFFPEFFVGLDDVELVGELGVFPIATPAPGSCNTTGWADVVTQSPPTTGPSTAPPPTVTPIIVVPPLEDDDEWKVSCNFEGLSINPGVSSFPSCGWRPAFSNGSRFVVELPMDIAASSRAFVAKADSGFASVAAVSGTIQGSGEARKLQFQFASHTRAARSLAVHLVNDNVMTATPVWSFTAFGGGQPWALAIAEYQAPTGPYRLIIQAKFLSQIDKGAIAVDNIVLENEDGAIVGTLPPVVLPTRPTLTQVFPTTSCTFDGGACTGWSHLGGLGEWAYTTAAATGTDPQPVPPQTGAGFVFAVGGHGPAELTTAPILFTSTTTQIIAQVKLYLNIYPTPGTPIGTGAGRYTFKVSSVSVADGREQELSRRDDTTGTSGWTEVLIPFCLTKASYLKFEVEQQRPADFNFAIDEIFTTALDAGVPIPVCQVIPTAGPEPPFPTPATLPDNLKWERIDSLSCNFDNGSCPNFVPPLNAFPFIIHTNEPVDLPPHVLPGSQSGSNFAITACSFEFPAPMDTTSGMQLPSIPVEAGSILYGRISFWYIFIGLHDDTKHLSLSSSTGWETTRLWLTTDGQTPIWRFAQVTFASRTAISLTFTVDHADCTTPTALDTILVERGLPGGSGETSITCDFEDDHLCAWDLADGPNRWKLGRGLVGTPPYDLNGAGPGLGEGFVYVDSSLLPFAQEPAEIDTQYFPYVNSELSFYYRAYGYGVATITLFIETNATRYVLWSRPSHGRDWQSARVPVCSTGSYKLIFEARFIQLGFVVGLDGIVLASEALLVSSLPPTDCDLPPPHVTVPPVTTQPPVTAPPPVTRPTVPPFVLPTPWSGKVSCDFEANTLCEWKTAGLTAGEQELVWTVSKNATIAATTNSHFAVTAPTSTSGVLARLMSPSLPGTGAAILEFYYRTSGRASSGVSVYAVQSATLPASPVWSSGQGLPDRWSLAVVSVPFSAVTRRQILLQTQFISRNGWTAIDNIVLNGEDGQVVATTAALPTVGPLRPIISPATCSFDLGLCGLWSPSTTAQWQWQDRPQPSEIPSATGTGGYVYVVNDSHQSNKTEPQAELRSGPFESPNGAQLTVTVEFWYWHNQTNSIFALHQLVEKTHQRKTEFSTDHPTANPTTRVWLRGEATFCLMSREETRLLFTATPTSHAFQFAALDEVVTHRRIEQNEVCPESTSLTCSFSNGICGWETNLFVQPPTAIQPNAPSGNFLLSVDKTAESHYVRSIPIWLTKRTQLTFKYNMFLPNSISSVTVEIISEDAEVKQLWAVEGGPHVPANIWLPARVSLCHTGQFRLSIVAVFKDDMEGAKFAIDDIVINNEESAITYEPSEFECTPFPQATSPTVTCSLESIAPTTPANFCGWKPTTTIAVGANVSVGILDQVAPQGQADSPYLSVVPDSAVAHTEVVIRSSEIQQPSAGKDGEFSFWYRLVEGNAELYSTASESAAVKRLNLTQTPVWTPASFVLMGTTSTGNLTMEFRIVFAAGTAFKATPARYFALDSTYYSAEPGFEPDVIEEPVTSSTGASTVATTIIAITSTPSKPTINTEPPATADTTIATPEITASVTNTGPTTFTDATKPSTEPDGSSVRTTTPELGRPTAGPNTQTPLDKYAGMRGDTVIGLASACGVLFVIAVAVLLWHFAYKRQAERRILKAQQVGGETIELAARPGSSAFGIQKEQPDALGWPLRTVTLQPPPPNAMPSPTSDQFAMGMLDVERPMLPAKKNSLYAFAQRQGGGVEEEPLQLDESGLHRFVPKCLRSQFADAQQEGLYKKYYTSQKQGDLVAFVMTALSWQFFCGITYAFRHPDLRSGKELSALIILILAFAFNCTVIAVYKLRATALKEQRLLRQVVPLLVFVVLYSNFFLDLLTMHHPLLPSDGISFQILFIYATLTMLPLGLRLCVALGVASSAALLTIHGLYSPHLRGHEVVAAGSLYLGALLLGILGAFVSDRKQRRAFRQARISIAMKLVLEQQAQEHERLLLAVLPKHLAAEIRQDLGAMVHGQFKKMFISRYENVSILFADIVGFTALSSNCTAAELVKLLNKLITRFDKLSEKYHQLRIKILGDCYYCISGAPEPRVDHAVLCCHMGLAMVDAIRAVREETRSSVDMRVGIHTGSVLAGVMGQRQHAYDVYSKDTKLANAMESGGIPGRVHISETTYACLNGEFEVVPGNGELRNSEIKASSIKTYIIESVIKPYPEGTLDADRSRLSVQNEQHALSYRRGSQRPSGHNGVGVHGEAEFDDRLLQALIAREGATIKGKANYATLSFLDPVLETQFCALRDKLGPALISANCLVVILSCIAHGILWQLNIGTGVAYAAAVTITFLISCLAWAGVKSKAFHPSLVKFVQWTETVPSLRLVWLSSIILIAAVPEIADRLACTTSSDHACDPPVFYLHLITFLLLGVTILVQLRHLHKVLMMTLLITVHCLLTTLHQQLVFDSFDLDVISDSFRNSFPTKYASCVMLVVILFALFWLNRYTEVTSRLLFVWKKESDAQKEQVGELRRKNEELVYNILPRHVAKHFLGRNFTENEEPYSEHHAGVGIMFASMPNFAEFYSEESVNKGGIECLRFLNEIISDYDQLLDDLRFQGSITKIKTIGATYMAASGLTNTDIYDPSVSIRQRWRHLDQLVRFALGLQEKLRALNEQSFNNFELRIGINHGPISAGVIGVRKPHYDIWGNAVNVASRMESTGKPGSIQVTEECMHLLKEFGYIFQSRGEVEVKGKGKLQTYYLVEPYPEPPPLTPV
ncbi:Adenylate cyclase type 3 [Hypsibius exemplaris]|uniref:adenylate cyclase n=1 Tax=Hypsibius exemplaris TaxID=2072580 RepID=A0A1W0X8T5_HYPEX|nr:Adenylate cyclase type 3 [Hypsibius exemplaris]